MRSQQGPTVSIRALRSSLELSKVIGVCYFLIHGFKLVWLFLIRNLHSKNILGGSPNLSSPMVPDESLAGSYLNYLEKLRISVQGEKC